MKLSIAHLRAAGLSDSQIVKVLEEADAERREKARIIKRNQRARPPDRVDSEDKRLKKEKKDKKETNTPIHADWQPSDRTWWVCKGMGWGDQRLREEVEAFRDHALQNNRKLANWDAGFRNWMRSSYRKRGTHQSVKDRNREVMDELNEFIERAEDDERRGCARGSQADQQLPLGEPDGAQGIPRRAGLRLVEIPGRGGNRGSGPGDASEPEFPAASPLGRKTVR